MITTTREFRHYAVLVIAFAEAVLLVLLGYGYDEWRDLATGFGTAIGVMTPLMLIAEVRLNRREPAKE